MNDEDQKIVGNEKVMDVSSPGEALPSPTQRPVIVSNRSMVNADPMVASSPVANNDAKSNLPEVSEDPTSNTPEVEPSEQEPTTELPEVTETPAESSEQARKPRREKVLRPISTSTSADPNAENPSKDQPASSPSEQYPTSENEEVESEALKAVKDKYQGEKVPDSDVESANREAELLAIAEQKTYKLPLGQRKKHTERILIMLLIGAIFLVLLLNLALDAGLLNIPGAPHTNFFAK